MTKRVRRPLSDTFRGATHPPRYGTHKYWARKPANVVRSLIEHYTRRGDLVLDPFCGSGVTVIEAALTGRRAIGIDVNPIAVDIVTTTLTAVDDADIVAAMALIEACAGRVIDRDMTSPCPGCGATARVRYRIWSSVVSCPSCGAERFLGTPGSSTRRPSRCVCGIPLPSAAVTCDELHSVVVDCKACRPGSTPFPAAGRTSTVRSGPKFLRNGRILAHDGLRAGHLYCKENWRHMRLLARAVSTLDGPVRAAMHVALTSTAAQASRMIPYRGNLCTGGPAWTVPGFWVPPVHLQLNVWKTFCRRVARLRRGLDDARRLGAHPSLVGSVDEVLTGRRRGGIALGDARSLPLPSASVEYIVTDPPYGDSVPYLEFSQLWLSWSGVRPVFEHEIVISDSDVRDKDIDTYHRDLATAFAEMGRVLKADGWVTCFFQNRSFDVWRSLWDASVGAGFRLERVDSLLPAVVPAKSQLSRSGSLVGDVVLQFRKGPPRRRHRHRRWRAVARATGAKHLRKCGGTSDFEQLALTVLTELWSSGCIEGQGDLAAFFREEFVALPQNRFGLRGTDHGC